MHGGGLSERKVFALALYHGSRKAYYLLQKIFSLPSPRTLATAMKNINIRPGLCRNMLNLFKVKVNSIAPQEKLCAIVVDEIALKRYLSYDYGSNNRAVMQKLGVTISKPYAFFGGKKLFMMFDPPHLMKSLRNNSKRHGFKNGEHDVPWHFIEKF
ncbi:THAP domain-containing protein 9 [Elysia marginata]|uniref:THAP domain-containing protein 9 n=1 Tax=Elysia marginata TaxID=1093978 RepID=A0AAV4ISB9_9GAST|nr:THAP domain-containing protein 9 [Elysia marginata]